MRHKNERSRLQVLEIFSALHSLQSSMDFASRRFLPISASTYSSISCFLSSTALKQSRAPAPAPARLLSICSPKSPSRTRRGALFRSSSPRIPKNQLLEPNLPTSIYLSLPTKTQPQPQSQTTRTMATPTAPTAENATPPPTLASSTKDLDTIEAAKRRAAYKAVEDHFDTSYKYIGIGSGSTVVYVVEAIAAKGRDVTSKMYFIPTGDQSKQLIIEAELPLGNIDSLPPVEIGHQTKMDGVSALQVATGLQDLGLKGKRQSLDVAFDGADEIDEDLNCIKGGGACLFQEKLVATAAKKFICVAGSVFRGDQSRPCINHLSDSRKLSPRLLTKWKSIPIEIAPLSAPTIKRILITLGSPDPVIRQGGSAKAGPVVTDNGMWIIDAPFEPLRLASDLKHGDHGDGEHGTWEVHHLGRRLKRIVGVLEVGLFHGRNGIQVANAGEEGGMQLLPFHSDTFKSFHAVLKYLGSSGIFRIFPKSINFLGLAILTSQTCRWAASSGSIFWYGEWRGRGQKCERD